MGRITSYNVCYTKLLRIQGTENAFNHKELTIKLNPEELGEVSIKLEKSGEEIKISIMAQNSNTQKLISEKLPNLITSLQQINSQVKDVAIVNQNDNASSFFNNFAHSQSQSGGQYQARHSQSANHYISIPENETEENILIREGELWQTA